MTIRVLLVDDETSFVETLGKRLTIRNLDVVTAGSADEAFDVLAREAVDVVLLDVKMPGTDGLTAIKTIKRRHPLVEVILLSGHANLEASVGGMALGAFDYLLKPVRLEELVYKIEDAYQRKSIQEGKIRNLREVGISDPDGPKS
ncbi:MAG: response regulator [Thermoanaerobaculales bacterium]|jgi:DNA-binding NtrC family response regulator|nr:response regulator [Thermoanaerobaculales bacterium]